MSKQSESKQKQMFQKKCPNCGNCKHFKFETEKIMGTYGSKEFIKQINLRCGIGNFAVGKSNWCKEHLFLM